MVSNHSITFQFYVLRRWRGVAIPVYIKLIWGTAAATVIAEKLINTWRAIRTISSIRCGSGLACTEGIGQENGKVLSVSTIKQKQLLLDGQSGPVDRS